MKIVLGITGASGFVYGRRALEFMANAGVEVHLVISDSALLNLELEGDVCRASNLTPSSTHSMKPHSKSDSKFKLEPALKTDISDKFIGKDVSMQTAVILEQMHSLAHQVYDNSNIGASIASGSFKTDGMLIAPCSINTMSAVASGISTSLIARAADVTLKERRKLVLMVRETPLHLGHLRSMCSITEMGGVIYPPTPSFYHSPKSLQDVVDHSVGRALDIFNIDTGIKRWN